MSKMLVIDSAIEHRILGLYKTKSIGYIGRLFKISDKRVKLVLEKNNIKIRTPRKRTSSGKKFDLDGAVHNRFDVHEGMQLYAVSRFDGTRFKDYLNTSGVLTVHLRKHGITNIPTLSQRVKIIRETGKLWYEEWFDFVEEPIKNVGIQCPYCSYHTTGDLRRPGFFIKHLWDVHNVSEDRFISEHPEYKERFSFSDPTIELQRSKNEDEYVVCAVCGKKMRKIGYQHLQSHGITKAEYIDKYCNGTGHTLSNITLQKFRERAKELNLNKAHTVASKKQIEIEEYISSMGYIAIRNDRQALGGIEIDEYIPSVGLGIEYNGNFWHNDSHNAKGKPKLHYDKCQAAYEKGIKLIMVFEDEYEQHRELVEAKIRQGLGLCVEVGNYGCHVKKISTDKAKTFLGKHCILGYSNATLNYGAYQNSELIAVMSFRKTKDKWILVRYCGKEQDESVSIAKLLYSTFLKEERPNTVEYLADRRWLGDSTNIFCLSLGFEFNGFASPDYTYYKPLYDRYERLNKHFTNKSRLLTMFPNLLNESMRLDDMLKKLGWSKIYDAGYTRYIYTANNGELCVADTSINGCVEDKLLHSRFQNSEGQIRKIEESEQYFNDFSEITSFIRGLVGDEHVVIENKNNITIPQDNVVFSYIELTKNQKNDMLKQKEDWSSKGIHAIFIFSDEYRTKRKIVQDKIRHFLHKDKKKRVIGGRKCDIVEISMDSAEAFLNLNHIQGFASGTVYLGALAYGELIAVSVYKKENNDIWNLSRFATNIDYSCPGVASKMFHYFIEHYKPLSVKSFLDRRYCFSEKDNIYTTLGFTADGYVVPDYRYFNKDEDPCLRHHKFAFRKQVLCRKYPELVNMSMTETEMVRKLGWERIYDCGLIRYIWRTATN